MKKFLFIIINYSLLIIHCGDLNAQLKWTNVDSLYQPLPASVHVYKTTDTLDGKPNIAFYVVADLKDKKLVFDVDTTHKRRLTPKQFYSKHCDEYPVHNACFYPLVVVNTTFFSFQTNQNLNVVIQNGKLIGYNIHSIPGRGKDTFTYRHPFGGTIGISRNRRADIAWVFTDSSSKYAYASQRVLRVIKDSFPRLYLEDVILTRHSLKLHPEKKDFKKTFARWEMQTAVGGGPVLLQNGQIYISNNEELKFAGNAINDKHPRTAMGYTKDNKLIILVVQGRFPGIAEGATLTQEAKILQDLGCREALNLDGGGSSCMLVNGKETIKPSDAGVQRAVPAVFIIRTR